jgi:aspartate carbamoyltransferase catalytic subunit
MFVPVSASRPAFHVLESQQFPRPAVEEIFERARELRDNPRRAAARLQGRLMATLFYEPSTRTRLSFEAAMLRLGGQVIATENAYESSSAVKGESLEDTIRVISGYADAIVLRHPESGAARRAAAVSSVPVINGGDGGGQHPTQALLDLFTIQEELGRVEGVKVALVGDLANGRAPRSLAYLLSEFPRVQLWLVAPPQLQMSSDVKAYLDDKEVRWRETSDLNRALKSVDVIYMTRIKKEYFASADEYQAALAQGAYLIDSAAMAKLGRQTIVMDCLPRTDKFDPAIDDDPRAAYFRQARNGLYVRMALLDIVLSQ